MERSATARLITLLAAAAVSTGAAPADKDMPALGLLLKCRSIIEATARLACYDEQAKSIEDRAARQDLVILDHEQVAATKRGLFGFSLPRIGLLGGRPDGGTPVKDDEPFELNRIDTTIKAVGRNGGRWTLILEDGARWEQVEAGRDADDPRVGMPISIRKASLGTYFARIGSHISMRIRRTG